MKNWVLVPVTVVVLSFTSARICTAQGDDRHIRPGDTGGAVTAVQSSLASYGYTVALDGQFGPQTERAVRLWQRANGLVVDGVVGPVTSATLRPAVRVNPPPAATPATPEQIIRAVWPDDSEQHALAIAYRESRWVPTVRNACCYGLFQIHFAAHRAWLAAFGVTSPAQLLDATTNARVALALYQAAGWGPWQL